MTMQITKYTNMPGTFEAVWLDECNRSMRVIAYSGDQIIQFRDDVSKYGGRIDEAVLAEVQAEWITPPASPPEVPQLVSRAQGEIALHRAGLLSHVEAYMADPGTDTEARIWWQRSQVFKRSSATVQAVASALGLSDERVDALFTAAAAIDA